MTLEFKTIEEVNNMEDICFYNPYNEETLVDEIEDAFEDMRCDLCITLPTTKEVLKKCAEAFKKVEVYEKEYAQLSIDNIYDYLTDNYYIEDPQNLLGMEEIKESIEKFNNIKQAYISDKTICYVDVSKEAYEFLLDEYADDIVEVPA